MANNKIKFKHFFGSLAKWNAKIESGIWDDSIVFGRIYSDDGKWLYKIYAGTITEMGEDKTLYEYDVIAPEEFNSYKEKIITIENTLAVSIDPTTKTNIFSNEDFKNVLKNTINLLFSKNNENLEQRIKVLEDSVLWVIPEDID